MIFNRDYFMIIYKGHRVCFAAKLIFNIQHMCIQFSSRQYCLSSYFFFKYQSSSIHFKVCTFGRTWMHSNPVFWYAHLASIILCFLLHQIHIFFSYLFLYTQSLDIHCLVAAAYKIKWLMYWINAHFRRVFAMLCCL